MRQLIKTIHLGIWGVVFVIVAFLNTAPIASAYGLREGINAARGVNQPTDLFGSTGVVTTVINTLLFIVGALSVIMIIVGGLRYVVSGGNTTAVTAARNTILYALVGLFIAFLAFAAINFVLGSLTSGGDAGYTDV